MQASTFDARLWRAQEGSIARDNPRAAMITALEEKHIRLGMSRQQIIDLLGKPDASTAKSDIYDIGVSSAGNDVDAYEINYQEDIVVGFSIIRR